MTARSLPDPRAKTQTYARARFALPRRLGRATASGDRPAAGTPTTSPGDYVVLEAIFASALAGVVALSARRLRAGAAPIPRAELPAMAVATFALADVLAKERISTWLREPFVVESADHRPLEPAGAGMRRAVGELLTCTRCAGTWSALGLVALRTAFPLTGQVTINVLALTGANDLLQAGFRGLIERSNAAAPGSAGRSAGSVL